MPRLALPPDGPQEQRPDDADRRGMRQRRARRSTGPERRPPPAPRPFSPCRAPPRSTEGGLTCTRAPAALKRSAAAASGAKFRIDRRHDQIDAGVDAISSIESTNAGLVASGNRKRLVRRVAGCAQFRLDVAGKHVEFDARCRCRPAEAFDQSDPPARRRNSTVARIALGPSPILRAARGHASSYKRRLPFPRGIPHDAATTSATRRIGSGVLAGVDEEGEAGLAKPAAVRKPFGGPKPASTNAFSR